MKGLEGLPRHLDFILSVMENQMAAFKQSKNLI